MFELLYKLSRRVPGFSNILRLLYGCDIPRRAKIGDRVTFAHKGIGTVVHVNASIGDDCFIQHHATIGVGKNKGVPSIGKKCFIGPYAVILGDITIGDNCVIGTNAFITHDVPPNTIIYNKCSEYVIKDNHVTNSLESKQNFKE